MTDLIERTIQTVGEWDTDEETRRVAQNILLVHDAIGCLVSERHGNEAGQFESTAWDLLGAGDEYDGNPAINSPKFMAKNAIRIANKIVPDWARVE